MVAEKLATRRLALEPEQGFIANSETMKEIARQVEKVAKFAVTVLLSGESGVGKEVVAKAIHRIGPRADKPFIKINCGAIPEHLLESELFGYERGAFTGADPKGKVGYFRMADSGVLFLDEIGEFPLPLQVKLLRVLQESEVTPLGGSHAQKIDVQIIAATNANLSQMVRDGLFRKDLYYRLNVVPIHIPPLREHLEDVADLAGHFVQKYNLRYGRAVTLTDDACVRLECCAWYGNVRELEHVIERLVVTCERDVIDGADLDAILPSEAAERENHMPIVHTLIPLQKAVDSVEEQLIRMAIAKYKTVKLAAGALEMSIPTLSRKYRAIRERQMERQLELRGQRRDRDTSVFVEELDKQLRIVAVVAAASIHVEDIIKVKESPGGTSQVFCKLQRQLTSIREQEGTIEWTYIWHFGPDGRVINLVSDLKLKMAPREEYIGPQTMISAVQRAMDGTVTVTPKYTDKFGEWKSCLAPIRDATGQIVAIFGSDYSATYIDQTLSKLSAKLK